MPTPFAVVKCNSSAPTRERRTKVSNFDRAVRDRAPASRRAGRPGRYARTPRVRRVCRARTWAQHAVVPRGERHRVRRGSEGSFSFKDPESGSSLLFPLDVFNPSTRSHVSNYPPPPPPPPPPLSSSLPQEHNNKAKTKTTKTTTRTTTTRRTSRSSTCRRKEWFLRLRSSKPFMASAGNVGGERSVLFLGGNLTKCWSSCDRDSIAQRPGNPEKTGWCVVLSHARSRSSSIRKG